MFANLPLPPNLANARWRHWSLREQDHRRYREALRRRLLERTIPLPPPAPLAKAHVRIVLHVCGRLMDHDNAYARVKWPCDWLVKNRYLVDDSPAHITLTVEQTRVKHRTEQGMTVYLGAA